MSSRPIRRIALVAPAGPIEAHLVTGAEDVLRQWGYEPVVGKHCLKNTPHYGIINHSATLEDRWADLRWAFEADDIDAVMCARGGFGAIHLLDRLTPQFLQAHPKWVIGFSDITAVHGALHHAGLKSIHGPMARFLSEQGPDALGNKALRDILQGNATHYHLPGHPLNRTGQASATLLGGNLALLNALLATPYNLIEPGCILFIEDIAEQVYQVQRILYTLRHTGLLEHLAGLIVGQFINYHENADGNAMYTMISDMVAPYSFPVAFDFPVGHDHRNLPLIEGAKASFTVNENDIFLDFSRE